MSQQFLKIVPSAFEPWAQGEVLKFSNPLFVCSHIPRGPKLKFISQLITPLNDENVTKLWAVC